MFLVTQFSFCYLLQIRKWKHWENAIQAEISKEEIQKKNESKIEQNEKEHNDKEYDDKKHERNLLFFLLIYIFINIW